MSKYFKLTVTSTTFHYLYINAPDSVDIDKVSEQWRYFNEWDFYHDPHGDWELHDLHEVEADDMDIFQVDWEDEIDA